MSRVLGWRGIRTHFWITLSTVNSCRNDVIAAPSSSCVGSTTCLPIVYRFYAAILVSHVQSSRTAEGKELTSSVDGNALVPPNVTHGCSYRSISTSQHDPVNIGHSRATRPSRYVDRGLYLASGSRDSGRRCSTHRAAEHYLRNAQDQPLVWKKDVKTYGLSRIASNSSNGFSASNGRCPLSRQNRVTPFTREISTRGKVDDGT